MDFEQAYMIGRSRAFFLLSFERRENLLLSLKDVLQVVKPQGKHYVGIRDIPVEKIIGTEDRPEDFSIGFYPIRKGMNERWTEVKRLLLSDRIPESIKVIEYGGYYFVSDGNHRVSVAKTNGIDFLTAEVTRYNIPVTLLCPCMRKKHLPLFKAKYDFYEETKVFDVLPEEHFQVACPQTWSLLKEEIFTRHKEWFIEKNQRVPDDEELILSWNAEIYAKTMQSIRLHSLPQLFPGKLDTDIYCDMMRFCQTFPQGTWFPGVYDRYIRKARRKHWLLAVPQFIRCSVNRYTMTVEDARKLFLEESRLCIFRPNAKLPEGNKEWYRFLTCQLLGSHFRYLREKLGREPYMHELTGDWYDRRFQPAYELYQSKHIEEPFHLFYMGWMKWWHRHAIKESKGVKLPKGFTFPHGVTISGEFTSFEEIRLPEVPEGLTLSKEIRLPECAPLPEGTTLPRGTVLSGGGCIPEGLMTLEDIGLSAGTPLPEDIVLSKPVMFPGRVFLPKGVTFLKSVTFPERTTFPQGMTFPKGTTVPQGLCLPKGVKLSKGSMLPARLVLPEEHTLQESFKLYLKQRHLH